MLRWFIIKEMGITLKRPVIRGRLMISQSQHYLNYSLSNSLLVFQIRDVLLCILGYQLSAKGFILGHFELINVVVYNYWYFCPPASVLDIIHIINIIIIIIFHNNALRVNVMSFLFLPNASFSLLSESVRKSISEASISSPHADPPVPPEVNSKKLSVKSQTCQDLGSYNGCASHQAQVTSETYVTVKYVYIETIIYQLKC